MNDEGRRPRRREVLATAGSLAAAGLAGCADGGSSGGGGRDTPEPEQQLSTPVAGDPDASVTVETFEDFACSHCQTYSLDVLPEIWSEYVEPGAVRYEWHDYPLPMSDQSWPAANAARSVQANAEDVATFWSYVELLFENQGSLSPSTYEDLANEVGVDGATIREETDDRTYEPTVVASKQEGRERGDLGTPAVFVDGERLDGYGAETVSGAIEDALDGA